MNDKNTTIKEKVKRFFEQYYQIPAVFLVMFTMWSIRMRPYDNFIRNNKIILSGNDPWYHYRQVLYTVNNWPETMKFDVYTGYPVGSKIGTFGTLYDQLLATISLVVGVGDPSTETIKLVMLLMPPIFASLTAIPVYLIGKNLKGRNTGLLATIILALLPGVFLNRGLAGVADHNIAEPLFMSIAILGLIYGIKNIKGLSITTAHLKDFDKNIKSLIKLSIISGIAIASYILVWPPGIFLFGIIGIFTIIYSAINYHYNNSIRGEMLLGAGSHIVVSLITLININKGFSFFRITLAHVISSLVMSVAFIGALFIYEEMKTRDINISGYIGFEILSLISAYVLIKIFQPSIIQRIRTYILLGNKTTKQTIGEAQTMLNSNLFSTIFSEYGIILFLTIILLTIYTIKKSWQVYNKKENVIKNGTGLLVSTWFLTTLSAALTQIRFNYYLAVTVSIMSAYLIATLANKLINDEKIKNISQIKSIPVWKTFTIIVLLIVMIAPLVTAVPFTVLESSSYHTPGGYTDWDDSLNWLKNSTPEYSSIEYNKEYKTTDDFSYEGDVYGVMSWWDYGHWITTSGKRIPVSNPFQQHAKASAKFLMSTNEKQAEKIMNNLSNNDENIEAKYVAIDWKMVTPGSKLSAPVVWNENLNISDIYDNVYIRKGQQISGGFRVLNQRYYESLMVRMFLYHGSAATPGNIALDYQNAQVKTQGGEKQTIKTVTVNNTSNTIKKYNNQQKLLEKTKNDSSVYTGGIGLHPHEKVDALQHYRMVESSDTSVLKDKTAFIRWVRKTINLGNLRIQDYIKSRSTVKIFEKVPGAKIQGTAKPNSTVVASVRINNSEFKEQFIYKQYAKTNKQGEFTMTLPYSTKGYDNWTTEKGYTEPEIKADSKYTFRTTNPKIVTQNNSIKYKLQQAKKHIPERAVIKENSDPIKVNLEETTINPKNPKR